MRFPARPSENGDRKRPTQRGTLADPVIVNQELSLVRLAVGETGSHGFATHAVEPAVDIADRSAERTHATTLLSSPQAADRLVVVVETIHRRDAIRRLLSMLTSEGIASKEERLLAQEAIREAARLNGGKCPPKRPETRVLFEETQAADNSSLNEILQGVKSASATFTGRIGANRGGNADRVARTLKISLVDENERQIAPQVGRGGMTKRRAGQGTTQQE